MQVAVHDHDLDSRIAGNRARGEVGISITVRPEEAACMLHVIASRA